MTRRTVAARAAAIFCLAFAAFQVALALGAPFGAVAWGGQSAVLPDNLKLASAAAAAFLVVSAVAMFGRAGDWGRRLPQWPFTLMNGLLCVQLALNTLANLAAKTPGEKFGMGGATILGFLLCLAALLPQKR